MWTFAVLPAATVFRGLADLLQDDWTVPTCRLFVLANIVFQRFGV